MRNSSGTQWFSLKHLNSKDVCAQTNRQSEKTASLFFSIQCKGSGKNRPNRCFSAKNLLLMISYDCHIVSGNRFMCYFPYNLSFVWQESTEKGKNNYSHVWGDCYLIFLTCLIVPCLYTSFDKCFSPPTSKIWLNSIIGNIKIRSHAVKSSQHNDHKV